MHEEQSHTASTESRLRLKCSGIWRATSNRDIEITAGEVIGSNKGCPRRVLIFHVKRGHQACYLCLVAREDMIVKC